MKKNELVQAIKNDETQPSRAIYNYIADVVEQLDENILDIISDVCMDMKEHINDQKDSED